MRATRPFSLLLAALLLGSAGQASAQSAPDWVMDDDGNAYVGEPSRLGDGQAINPQCPASLVGLQLEATDTDTTLDGVPLRDGEKVYLCFYDLAPTGDDEGDGEDNGDDDPGTALVVEIFHPDQTVHGSIDDVIAGLEGYAPGDGEDALEPDDDASASCERAIALVTQPWQYDADTLNHPEYIGPDPRARCQVSMTGDKAWLRILSAQFTGKWYNRAVLMSDDTSAANLEMTTGALTLFHARQIVQPDWMIENFGDYWGD